MICKIIGYAVLVISLATFASAGAAQVTAPQINNEDGSPAYTQQPENEGGVFLEQIPPEAQAGKAKQAAKSPNLSKKRQAHSNFTVGKPDKPTVTTASGRINPMARTASLPATHWAVRATLSSDLAVAHLPSVGTGLTPSK